MNFDIISQVPFSNSYLLANLFCLSLLVPNTHCLFSRDVLRYMTLTTHTAILERFRARAQCFQASLCGCFQDQTNAPPPGSSGSNSGVSIIGIWIFFSVGFMLSHYLRLYACLPADLLFRFLLLLRSFLFFSILDHAGRARNGPISAHRGRAFFDRALGQ